MCHFLFFLLFENCHIVMSQCGKSLGYLNTKTKFNTLIIIFCFSNLLLTTYHNTKCDI